ncbi:tyrosinase family oxidase copper chaperone [Streptomyces sp. NPDC057638]|uniref:tyrosinase family oxidase copper chaperone n=1 Tax=Streptomyces sp. NPDC057638 TaxID=3346190 RepID=UPI003676492E
MTRQIPTRRALVVCGAVAGAAGVLVPLTTRERDPAAPRGRELERFSEVYRGRRIQGSATLLMTTGRDGQHPAAPSVEVRIDGRPLRVMRRADGGYLSHVNHYESFPTLREVARAAVDDLGTAQLAWDAPHGHH